MLYKLQYFLCWLIGHKCKIQFEMKWNVSTNFWVKNQPILSLQINKNIYIIMNHVFQTYLFSCSDLLYLQHRTCLFSCSDLLYLEYKMNYRQNAPSQISLSLPKFIRSDEWRWKLEGIKICQYVFFIHKITWAR